MKYIFLPQSGYPEVRNDDDYMKVVAPVIDVVHAGRLSEILGESLSFIVDDDGKMGEKKAPNPWALLLGAVNLFLVGDISLVGINEASGDTVDVSDAMVKLVERNAAMFEPYISISFIQPTK